MPTPTNNNNETSSPSFFYKAWDFVHDLIDLKDGLDREGTVISIKNNKEMKGANAWLLMCSILIASLGLDLNSPAVIIGAMLISPLMSPILGIGLGIGINDRNTLTISGKHLLIAIAIALVTSTLYFGITNWLAISGGFTDEIRGRTRPSILDAMVALIGGFAGIISSSRKDKSNAIPGVAIATALMPPLCVTGYGLAQSIGYLLGAENINSNFASVTFNSFFLFVLNATLVALGTYLIVRFMDFPTRAFESQKEERQSKFFLYFTSFILLGISIFTTYNIIKENNTTNNINKFINVYKAELKLVEYEIIKDFQTNTFNIEVDVLGNLTDEKCEEYNQILKSEDYNVQNAHIQFNYPDEKKLKEMAEKSGENFFVVQQDLKKMESEIDSLNTILNTVLAKNKNEVENNIKFIARANFPELQDIKCYLPINKDDPPSLALQWDDRTFKREKLRKQKEERLTELVTNLMEFDTLVITYLAE